MESFGGILEKLRNDPEIVRFEKGEPLSADSIESLAFAVAAFYRKDQKNLTVVVPSLYDVRTFTELISQLLPEEEILRYPTDEVLRIEAISSSKEMLKERIYTLGKLLSGEKHILVLNSISLIHEVSKPDVFQKKCILLKKGQTVPPLELEKQLTGIGYTKVNKVEEVFQFARRGEIMDIFSPANPDPVRVEYFDDEIDDLRLFNALEEVSYKEVPSLEIVPGSENLFEKEETAAAKKRIEADLEEEEKKYGKEKTEELTEKVNSFLANVQDEGIGENQARYLPYFLGTKHGSVLDYLLKDRILFYRSEDDFSTMERYYQEALDYFSELYKAHLSLPLEKNCFSPDLLQGKFAYEPVLDEKSTLSVTDIPLHFISIGDTPAELRKLKNDGYKLYIALSEERYARYQSVLTNQGVKFADALEGAERIDAVFHRGFLLPAYNVAVLTQSELFGAPEGNSFFLKRFKEAKIINKYSELAPGDYVVHEEQGIGIYRGITTIHGLEYLTIEYGGNGNPKLFVPLDKFRLIRKYSSKDGMRPKLDTLGGASWARRKAKIRGRVAYLADRLLEIAAKRKALPGYSLKGDPELEAQFGDAFMFPLTLGQQKALEEIYNDMEQPHPMDRLLAGDVGFGKTEVAFRAAFRAIVSGKQAALLCPTTVLVRQHYQVAVKRFAGFGVKIAALSRNVSDADQKKIVEELKEGKIDFIIGTHRLLSSDVKFKDLGLLIVDEEQRFGVTHKEKIKELYSNIDVLTLTATPIPRTLQMSLLNVRQLSLLADAPVNRLPIKTYVVKYDQSMVREVISRELGRQGQVYYLSNRIQTIYKKAEEIQKMFPSAHVGVIHGQLDAEEMSDIMNDFYDRKIDILVCTTIIETGIDVPNCNTIVIEKAENFGLAQLYQIKGRVGRSSRLAYAYLTYPDYGMLDEDSRKRLKALKSFTELGSGYKIATEDLNIRGAGDILGKEQAGFIDSIGYDAYMRLLEEVMKEKKVADKGKADTKKGTRFELQFSLDAHIPENYASEADRINLYRELYDIVDMGELKKFERKVRDVYGHFPTEMQNLFLKKTVEILLDDPRVADFKEFMDRYDVRMSEEYSTQRGIGMKLSNALDKYDRREVVPRFVGKNFSVVCMKTSDYLLGLFDVLSTVLKLGSKDLTGGNA